MNAKDRCLSWILAAGLLAVGSVNAQPSGMAGGSMPHGHGMMMGAEMGGGAMMLPGAIQGAASKLQLDASQQAVLKQAEADAQAAHKIMRSNMDKVRQSMDAELAKNVPDFAAVTRVGDEVKAENDVLHRKVRDQWLALYASLSDAQKQTVRDAILAFRANHHGMAKDGKHHGDKHPAH